MIVLIIRRWHLIRRAPLPLPPPKLLPGSDYLTGRRRNEAVKEGHNNTMDVNYECSSADDAHTDWGAAGYLTRLWPHWLGFQDTPKNSTRHTEVQEFVGGRRGFLQWPSVRAHVYFIFHKTLYVTQSSNTMWPKRHWIQCYLTLFVWYYYYYVETTCTQVKHVQQKHMHYTCVSTFIQCIHGKFHF